VPKPVEFRPGALQDLDDAVTWLEEARAGLGPELLAEVREAIQRLMRAPEIGAPVAGAPEVRSIRVHRFSYRIFFAERSDRIRILAVAHHRRRPGYWKARLEP
jgi:plasmid stabilization system protein ParE